jgi:hypothetical protein
MRLCCGSVVVRAEATTRTRAAVGRSEGQVRRDATRTAGTRDPWRWHRAGRIPKASAIRRSRCGLRADQDWQEKSMGSPILLRPAGSVGSS